MVLASAPHAESTPYIERDTPVDMDLAMVAAEIERLRAENARLRATPLGYYAEHGVYRFKGKSEVKRQNYELGLPCGCRAYREVLTAGRWRALGRMIRKGESACHRAGKRASIPLWCACQTEPRDDTPGVVDSLVVTETQNIEEIPF